MGALVLLGKLHKHVVLRLASLQPQARGVELGGGQLPFWLSLWPRAYFYGAQLRRPALLAQVLDPSADEILRANDKVKRVVFGRLSLGRMAGQASAFMVVIVPQRRHRQQGCAADQAGPRTQRCACTNPVGRAVLHHELSKQ